MATFATCDDCDPEQSPSIGRPLPGTQVYILDRALQQVPVGVPGELYIGGAGLGRGYLHRPELTDERFILNPIPDAPSKRLYRTGDRGRWRPDGNIEFLGRTDRQVKLRGFRIELGEIESLLLRHPEVAEAAVLLAQDVAGEQRLVAYVVARSACAADFVAVLLRWLKEQLPEYMVPGGLVVLDQLPLSAVGKIERSALPMPALQAAGTQSVYEAPDSAIEQLVITVWQQVLCCERIGVHDNFFDLGGHSLRLAAVQSLLQSALAREVPMMDLFRYPTVRELAGHLSSPSAGGGAAALCPDSGDPRPRS